MQEQVADWIKAGVIKESSSEFCSPVVVTKKKDGSSRVCIDYRRLNQKVMKDHFPMPIIEDQLDKLQEAKVFSTLDLRNGFFHVLVAEKSKKYTSFITSQGQYEFNRAPFGLTISPGVFLRFVNIVFSKLIKNRILLTYMDDIIIPSIDEEESIIKFKEVLRVAEENGLEIKWSKCSFLKKKVQFLEHVIENGTNKPSDEKIAAVNNFPEPNTIHKICL